MRGADFILSVKWLCAPRGRACGVGQFFLLVKRLAFFHFDFPFGV